MTLLVLTALGPLMSVALASAAAPPPGRVAMSPAAAKVPAGPGSLAGSWYNSDFNPAGSYDPKMQVRLTREGKLPPLQPWAAELRDKRVKDAEAGRTFATTLSQCLPSGMPAMLFYPAVPIRILETPGQVTMLVEQGVTYRIIRLDASHREDFDPGFMGDSVGHWEADTLVVDTIGLTDRTTIDQAGMPHSEDLHLLERYRRTSVDAFEIVMRIEDPKTFAQPWTTVTHFKTTPPARSMYQEYYCENQRNYVGTDGVVTNGASATVGP